MPTNYRQLFSKKWRIRQDWLKLNPNLNNESGIYILTREENGFKYAYVGQAVHILDRLVSHSMGFEQHIDKSLLTHKLYSEKNPTGWKVWFINLPQERLNGTEQRYIMEMAQKGYQLRNKTSGSQGEGKQGIASNKESKGYRQGVADGRSKILKELKTLLDKYLVVSVKDSGKRASNGLEKFWSCFEEIEETDEN